MKSALPFSNHLGTLAGFTYISLWCLLASVPAYVDMSPVKSMNTFYSLYAASAVLAGICLINGLAKFGVMRQPDWARDESLLPLCGVLAFSWIAL